MQGFFRKKDNLGNSILKYDYKLLVKGPQKTKIMRKLDHFTVVTRVPGIMREKVVVSVICLGVL